MKELLDELKRNSKSKRSFGRFVIHAITKHPELVAEIENQTQFLDEHYDNILIGQRVYHIWTDENVLLCPICKKRVLKNHIHKNTFFKYGVSCGDKECRIFKLKQTCMNIYGVEYSLHSEEVREKMKQTCVNLYGVEHVLQSEEIREKARQTMITKYGVENVSQSDEIKEKKKQTCMDRYGVEYISQIKEVREKAKQTNKIRFGVEHVLQSGEIRKKIRQTNMVRYGVDYGLQSEEVIEKSKQTMINKYGVENVSQSDEIKEKKKQTCMTNFGVEHATQSEKVKEKMKQTCMNRYNVEYASQSDDVKEKRKYTCMNLYGVEHPSQVEEFREKSKQTSLKNWGVEYPMQNPEIFHKSQKAAKKRKPYILPSGKIIKLQGYEHHFLNEYFLNGLSESSIIHGKEVPIFSYYFDGSDRFYYPDFYIPSENKIIEVKSARTLSVRFEQNLLKRQACLDAGFNFEFWIYDPNGNRLDTEQVIKDIEAELYGKLA